MYQILVTLTIGFLIPTGNSLFFTTESGRLLISASKLYSYIRNSFPSLMKREASYAKKKKKKKKQEPMLKPNWINSTLN